MAIASNETVLQRPAGATGPWRLQIAGTLADVDQLAPAWRALGAEVGHPLVQYTWSRAALGSFGDGVRPQVVACYRGDRLVALAPLELKRVNGVRRLTVAGADDIYEPVDFAWADLEPLNRLLRGLVKCGSPLVLERVAVDSPLLAAIKRVYRNRAVVITRPRGNCPYIALDETWLDPEQHLNSGRRSDLRRARRKAEQIGPLATEIHVPELDDLPRLLDICFEVEAQSWKGETGTALAHDAHRAVFYRQYAQAAAIDGVLRICLLRIGDHVAAMQLAIEQGGGFWLLKVGYDAQFAACSPGNLLMRDTIRYAVEAGLSSYEFLGRAESWTRVWTQTEREYVAVRVYPLSTRGLAAFSADGTVSLYRRWRKQ